MDAGQNEITLVKKPSPPPTISTPWSVCSLSEAYVSALAYDQRSVVDGPRAGVDTGYDLKKPMAVLLQAILKRLDRIEAQMTGNRCFTGEMKRVTFATEKMAPCFETHFRVVY